MSNPTVIRILETTSNRKGDLFARLMGDLFVALGYDQPRVNVQKSGRELDLFASHRLEERQAIAECKATEVPSGGADLNKFVGVLDVERTRKRSLTGYFISLSGFKETALEQESQRQRKIITLDGPQVVAELIKGRILIPREKATELSGRYCGALKELVLDENAELLAHERGWIWAVYYSQGKDRSHFALIHSDGTPLARAVADEVILSDHACGGGLYKLTCLNPSPLDEKEAELAKALDAYRIYLFNECGFIQLDGLPADSDVGSRKLRLENLFVPLHVDVTINGRQKLEREKIGETLFRYKRVALLAAPGGGKSTLVKRLAVAYIDPARREEIGDDLPASDWFPLFFRCRELRELARGSFSDLLRSLAEREPIRQHAREFRALADRALLAGRALLLVDGLDEISDPGDRAAFVCTLRSAVQAYPNTALVVTSREAGFRHVAAHLAPLCTIANLSPFDDDDIRRLSVAWHTEVVGDNVKVRSDAESLAATVVKNDRIRRLAVNPLLLTTLLLVKRWVGSLPTRRAALYGKAVEVLLMTWNTEGHEPIPDDQALPQLCYVASAMMLDGLQKVSRQHLAFLIQEARTALPTELGYVQNTVDDFIHRIEDRSSLLMMSGLDVENGQLVEFFEFRHLTFQEFLTARAMVEGWHRDRQASDTLVDVLRPHFTDEQWREVVPLAAVLGGKATDALISGLTEAVSSLDSNGWLHHTENPFLQALGNCLADEAAAHPHTIRAAMMQLVRFGGELHNTFHFTSELARGRYGQEFREVARKYFVDASSEDSNARFALLTVVWWQTLSNQDLQHTEQGDVFLRWMNDSFWLTRCEGALGVVALLFFRKSSNEPDETTVQKWFEKTQQPLDSMLFSDYPNEHQVAAWLLRLFWDERVVIGPDVLERLFVIWRRSTNRQARQVAAWALANQPLIDRNNFQQPASASFEGIELLMSEYDDLHEDFDYPEKTAALVIAWYTRTMRNADIAKLAQDLIVRTHQSGNETRTRLQELLAIIMKSMYS